MVYIPELYEDFTPYTQDRELRPKHFDFRFRLSSFANNKFI